MQPEVRWDDEDEARAEMNVGTTTHRIVPPPMAYPQSFSGIDLRVNRAYDFSSIHHPHPHGGQREQQYPRKETSNFLMGESHEDNKTASSDEEDQEEDENFKDEVLQHPQHIFYPLEHDLLKQEHMHMYHHYTFQMRSSQSQPRVTVVGMEEPFPHKRQWKGCRYFGSLRGWVSACCVLGLALIGTALWTLYSIKTKPALSSIQQDDKPPELVSLSPTASPPIPGPLGVTIWQQYRGDKGSAFGSAVLIDGNWVAVGAPGADSVATYYQHPDGHWEQVPEITAANKNSNIDIGSAFGSDVDFVSNLSKNATTPFMIVGAPEDAGGGSAFLYSFSPTVKRWQLLDRPLTATGDDELIKNAKFGSAVVISETLRVVIAAPQSGADKRGRIFTFQVESVVSDAASPPHAYRWIPIPSATIAGSGEGSEFGSDLDITADGGTIVVGEPKQNSFVVYDWMEEENNWTETFRFRSADEHVDFGSSVVFLSATHVAVGAPSANKNTGFVSLFQKDEASGMWYFLKSIEGKMSGDHLGAKGTVSGSQGPWGTQLIVSTHQGLVQRHDLVVVGNSSYLLVERFTVNIASATSIDVEADEDGFVLVAGYGGADLVLLYGPPYESVPTPPPAESASAPDSKEIHGELVGATKSARSGYGASVALAGDFVVVGEPLQSDGAGAAELFRATTEWSNVDTIVDSGTEEFGSAIASSLIGGKASLLVGAKATCQDSTSSTGQANYGSAHYFELDDAANTWTHVGEPLYPQVQPSEAGGEFGAAVAMSSTDEVRRIAIGAPSSSMNTYNHDNGRVYTYEYNGASWQPIAAALVGDSGNFLGSAVSLTSNGSRMLVGAPGGDKAIYYVWNQETAAWDDLFVAEGDTGEAFGSSAAVVANDGSVIAVGGPAYGNGRGVVRVYSQHNGSFHQMGSDIYGNDGDRIGTTLCGTESLIAFGTDQGFFRVYSLADGNWRETAHGGFPGSPVISIAISQAADTLAVGLANEQVWIYTLS
ncbi:hypothetical protein ACA910_005763 [Epithemia clementina (nom. ined.)]